MKITSDHRTSTAYRFTVEMKDGKPVEKDAELVAHIRESVRLHNKCSSDNKYVKLCGRGPRPSKGYHMSLPLSMANSADVYVYDR